MLLALLIIAAAACLVTGLVTANIVFTYVALGITVAAAILVIGNVLLHKRHMPEVSTDTADQEDEGRSDEEKSADTDDLSAASAPDPEAEDSELVTAEAPDPAPILASAEEVSTSAQALAADNGANHLINAVESDPVFVVPGRKRFHRHACHLLRQDSEELTLEEAREEGFTGCTACSPDLSLATNPTMLENRRYKSRNWSMP